MGLSRRFVATAKGSILSIDVSWEISMWMATVTTTECDQVQGRSERPRSGLPSLTTAESDQVLLTLLPRTLDLDCLLSLLLSVIRSEDDQNGQGARSKAARRDRRH